jgi:hypothetical protein
MYVHFFCVGVVGTAPTNQMQRRRERVALTLDGVAPPARQRIPQPAQAQPAPEQSSLLSRSAVGTVRRELLPAHSSGQPKGGVRPQARSVAAVRPDPRPALAFPQPTARGRLPVALQRKQPIAVGPKGGAKNPNGRSLQARPGPTAWRPLPYSERPRSPPSTLAEESSSAAPPLPHTSAVTEEPRGSAQDDADVCSSGSRQTPEHSPSTALAFPAPAPNMGLRRERQGPASPARASKPLAHGDAGTSVVGPAMGENGHTDEDEDQRERWARLVRLLEEDSYLRQRLPAPSARAYAHTPQPGSSPPHRPPGGNGLATPPYGAEGPREQARQSAPAPSADHLLSTIHSANLERGLLIVPGLARYGDGVRAAARVLAPSPAAGPGLEQHALPARRTRAAARQQLPVAMVTLQEHEIYRVSSWRREAKGSKGQSHERRGRSLGLISAGL